MLTWPEFEQRLTAVLTELSDRCFLGLTTPDNEFAQFLVADTWAYVQVSRRRMVDGTTEGILRRCGFTLPATQSGYWNCHITLPAPHADWALLARAAIGVIRDLFGVQDPAELTYQARREPEPKPSFFKRSKAPLDPGQDRIELPALGLTYRD